MAGTVAVTEAASGPAESVRQSRTTASDPALPGAAIAGLLCAGAAGAGFVGVASIMQLLFPLTCLVAGLTLLASRRWHGYLAFTLVLWLAAPEVRRVLDWHSSYHSFSIAAAAPSLVTLVAFPWVLMARRRLHRDVAIMFSVAVCVMAYALVVGVIRNGIVAALADGPLIVAPLVFGLFVLLVPDDDERVRSILRHTVLWGALLVGGYAVVQFLTLPPWDEAWMIDSNVGNLGDPVAKGFRVFGTLPTASYLAQTLTVMLLLLVAERRTVLQWVAAGAGLAGLALTLSRAGWLGAMLGVVVLALMGRARVWRFLAAGVLVFLVLAAIGSPIVDRVQARIDETKEGTQDTSFVARYWFQVQIAPVALADYDGSGMGATGRAGLVGGDPKWTNARYASFDTGIFESLIRYGSVAGLAMLGTLGAVTMSIVWRSRRGSIFDACCGAALVALMLGMVFQDMQRGIFGVWLWTLFALQGRVRQPAASD